MGWDPRPCGPGHKPYALPLAQFSSLITNVLYIASNFDDGTPIRIMWLLQPLSVHATRWVMPNRQTQHVAIPHDLALTICLAHVSPMSHREPRRNQMGDQQCPENSPGREYLARGSLVRLYGRNKSYFGEAGFRDGLLFFSSSQGAPW